jgi:hypothetical protein
VLGKIGVLTAEPAASPPTGNGHAGQAIGTEKVFAEVLHVERVPVDSHFFDDLGAGSCRTGPAVGRRARPVQPAGHCRVTAAPRHR